MPLCGSEPVESAGRVDRPISLAENGLLWQRPRRERRQHHRAGNTNSITVGSRPNNEPGPPAIAHPFRARAQQRSGRVARMETKVVKSRTAERKAGEGGLKGEQAGLAVLFSSSSVSERMALTRFGGEVTDVTDRRVEWVGGIAKLRRRQLGQEEPPVELDGQIGEDITATSRASADAMQIPCLGTSRLDIAPRIPGP